MISKRDLLAGIDANTEQIIWQGQLISDLKSRVEKLERELSLKKQIKVKKSPGRPKKICIWTDEMSQCPGVKAASDILEKEIEKSKEALAKAKKSSNAKKQPRGKDGKFAKK